jgi:hypothetical protein
MHLKSNPMMRAVITPDRTRTASWAKNADMFRLLTYLVEVTTTLVGAV